MLTLNTCFVRIWYKYFHWFGPTDMQIFSKNKIGCFKNNSEVEFREIPILSQYGCIYISRNGSLSRRGGGWGWERASNLIKSNVAWMFHENCRINQSVRTILSFATAFKIFSEIIREILVEFSQNYYHRLNIN